LYHKNHAKKIYQTNLVSQQCLFFLCETFRTSRPKQEILVSGNENLVLTEKKWFLRRNKMKTHTFAPSFYLKTI